MHSIQALARVPMPTTISPMEEPVLTRATFSSKQNCSFLWFGGGLFSILCFLLFWGVGDIQLYFTVIHFIQPNHGFMT